MVRIYSTRLMKKCIYIYIQIQTHKGKVRPEFFSGNFGSIETRRGKKIVLLMELNFEEKKKSNFFIITSKVILTGNFFKMPS